MSDALARAEALLEQAHPHLHELVIAEEHLRELVDDLRASREALADKRRLTRELDVALSGPDAAKQASLCDLVEPVRNLREERDRLREALHEHSSTCTCGCPLDAHENYGEDGFGCEHEEHECMHASAAVSSTVCALRYVNTDLRGRLATIHEIADQHADEGAGDWATVYEQSDDGDEDPSTRLARRSLCICGREFEHPGACRPYERP